MILAAMILLLLILVRVESVMHDGKHQPIFASKRFMRLPIPKVYDNDISILHSQHATPNCTSANNHNRLECFLWNLQVEIPEQSFKKDFITIDIHDMVCTNFYLRGLESQYQTSKPSDTKSFPKLQLSVHQMEATCQGRYHATGGIAGDVQAHVIEEQQRQLSGDSNPYNDDFRNYQNPQTEPKALNVVFGLRPDDRKTSTKIPSKCTAESCGTHLTCQNIHFSGSISAKLIQAFSKTISKYITDALQTYICPKIIQQQATTLVTHFLQHPLHDFVEKYLPETTTNKATTIVSNSSKDDNITNVVDYSMVRWMLNVLNDQLQKHLQQSWIPLPPGSDEDSHLDGSLPAIIRQLPSANPSNQHRQLPSDCQDMFRGISGWVKSIFGVRPRIRLPSYFHRMVLPISIQKSTVTVNISQLAIQGLDQMDSLQILQPPETRHRKSMHNSSNSTDNDQELMQTNLTSSTGFYLVAPVVVNITMPHKEQLVEMFELSLNVTQVEISLATALQVQNWSSTTMLQVVNAIQQFTDSFAKHHHGQPDWKALACLIQTLNTVEVCQWITNLIVDSLEVSRDKNIDGSLEVDLDATINTALQMVVKEYQGLWSLLMKGVIRDLGTSKLNEFVQEWIYQHSGGTSYLLDEGCPAPFHHEEPKYVNFSKFELFNQLNRFFENAKHIKTINHFLRCTGQSVELWSEWGASKRGFDWAVKSILGQEQVSMARIETNHWDALNKVQLLHPTGDKTLQSFVEFGNHVSIHSSSSNNSPPRATIVIDLEGPRLLGQINVTAFLSLETNAKIEVHYDLNRLENLTIDHLLQQWACGILPLVDTRLLPNASYLKFGDTVGLNVSALVNDNLVTISSTNLPQIHAVGNQVLDLWVEWVRSLFNKAMNEFAGLSQKTCPGVVMPSDGNKSSKEKTSGHFASSVWCILAVIVVSQAGLLWIINSDNSSQEMRYMDTSFDESELDNSRDVPSFFTSFQELIQPLTGTPKKTTTDLRRLNTPNSLDRAILGDIYERMNDDDEQHHITLEEQLYQTSNEEEPTKSMFSSSALSRVIVYSMPALIVATVVLFVTSNVSVGASVDVNVRVDETILPVRIFQFSLSNTVSELFHAGIYPLLMLVVCFSGVWPYVKLCWMLLAWMTPGGDQYQRERRLLKLDALGKFSLVDSYVLIIFVVAFSFHSEFSERLGINVFVTPMYGFYAFLLATCLSLVLGHASVFFHRNAKTLHSVDNGDSHSTESILDHAFEQENSLSFRRLARVPQILWICSIIGALVMLIMGFGQKCFTVTIGGLAGVALGEEYNGSAYSVVSLGAAIGESLENPSWFVVALLQGSYFFFTILTPIMCLTALLLLLVWPLTLRRQRCLLVIVEMSNAWSAIEVFLLSIFAALFQISEFASFLVGDKCDQINALAKTIIGGENFDTTCFKIDASVNSDCWYLVFGAVLTSWLVSVSLRFIHAAVEERTANLSVEHDNTFLRQPHPPGNHGWKMVQNLMEVPIMGWILFSSIDALSPAPEATIALAEQEELNPITQDDANEPAEQL